MRQATDRGLSLRWHNIGAIVQRSSGTAFPSAALPGSPELRSEGNRSGLLNGVGWVYGNEKIEMGGLKK